MSALLIAGVTVHACVATFFAVCFAMFSWDAAEVARCAREHGIRVRKGRGSFLVVSSLAWPLFLLPVLRGPVLKWFVYRHLIERVCRHCAETPHDWFHEAD